jgi:hypothetical protein
MDLLLVGHFRLLFTDLRAPSTAAMALVLRAAAGPLLWGADPPLCGSANNPNGRGGGVGCGPMVVLTSSWLRTVGPRRL